MVRYLGHGLKSEPGGLIGEPGDLNNELIVCSSSHGFNNENKFIIQVICCVTDGLNKNKHTKGALNTTLNSMYYLFLWGSL